MTVLTRASYKAPVSASASINISLIVACRTLSGHPGFVLILHPAFPPTSDDFEASSAVAFRGVLGMRCIHRSQNLKRLYCREKKLTAISIRYITKVENRYSYLSCVPFTNKYPLAERLFWQVHSKHEHRLSLFHAYLRDSAILSCLSRWGDAVL